MSSKLLSVTVGALFAVMVSVAALTGPAHASPERFVQTLSTQILAAAKTKNTARFRALLRRHADIKGIANFAVGRYKGKIPSGQLAKFYKLAEDDMVDFFNDYSSSLSGSGVTVKRVSQSGSVINVETSVNGTGTSVSWRLVQKGGYKVRDVQVLGIWLAHLMRSSYASELRRGGYKALFAYMQQ